jgi:hypothetical protein
MQHVEFTAGDPMNSHPSDPGAEASMDEEPFSSLVSE